MSYAEKIEALVAERDALKQRNLRLALYAIAVTAEYGVLTRKDEIRESIKPYESNLDEIFTDGFDVADDILLTLNGEQS